MHSEEAYQLILHRTGNKEGLAFLLNSMIENDFEGLIRLLYRVDVPEEKVKQLLQQPHTDTGTLLATLLIERQAQKAAFRKQAPDSNPPIPEDERW